MDPSAQADGTATIDVGTDSHKDSSEAPANPPAPPPADPPAPPDKAAGDEPAGPPTVVTPSVKALKLNSATLFTGDKPVSASGIPIWLLIFAAVVVIGFYLGGFIVVTPGNISPANGAAILAIITGAAVAIERILEAFWTFIDSRIGGWWPFSIVHDAINRLVGSFDQFVEPYLNRLRFARDAIAVAQRHDGEWKSDVTQILTDVNAVPDELKTLAATLQQSGIANDQKVAILAGSAANSITNILSTYPDLQKQLGDKVDLAKSLTDDLNSFLTTFDDNPARRSISLVVGCIAGYAVAIALQLDMFAVLGVPTAIGGWSAGVPLTGLIMGLGSNPTHEVIQAIQQYKQAKQTPATQQ
jgi:hypothetical protein